jgi:hypothetical protein
MYRLLVVFLFVVSGVSAQKISKADKEILKYLEANVVYLASDKLEGRRAGTRGETLAADFISSKFKEIGLLPKGSTDSYFQPFTVSDGKQILHETILSVNNKTLSQSNDFFPISNSPQSLDD